MTNTVNNRQLLKTLWEKEKLLLTPFPAMFSTQSDDCIPFVHDFDQYCQQLKTLWEKEKLLLTPFPAMFSTQSDDCIPFVHNFDQYCQQQTAFENIVGKGEIALNSFSHNVFNSIR